MKKIDNETIQTYTYWYSLLYEMTHKLDKLIMLGLYMLVGPNKKDVYFGRDGELGARI